MSKKDSPQPIETVSEVPTVDGHLPSDEQLLDTAIDLSFPASDPPAVSAAYSRRSSAPLTSEKESAALQPENKIDEAAQRRASAARHASPVQDHRTQTLESERARLKSNQSR